jgi:hypothetical protein
MRKRAMHVFKEYHTKLSYIIFKILGWLNVRNFHELFYGACEVSGSARKYQVFPFSHHLINFKN